LLIKNRRELLPSKLSGSQYELRKTGLKALKVAIDAVRPKNLIEKAVKIEENWITVKDEKFDLSTFKKICVIGGGKCVAEMAFTLGEMLKKYPKVEYNGFINVPEGLHIKDSKITAKIKINYANHPIPNINGLRGTKSMIELLEQSTEKDLIICLISGGGSALLPLPKEPLSLEDLQEINALLLESGASIQEINAVRKHLSNFKGGNLARKVFQTSRATLISLIISDVIGDDLDSIASGPTVPDSSTFFEAKVVLQKYKILEKIPKPAKDLIENGLNDKKLENPKRGDDCFKRVHNYLIGSVVSAIENVIKYLNHQMFETQYFSNEIAGEAQIFGETLYNLFYRTVNANINKKLALIGSGELTVTIKGNGIGGRNQEMLLSFLDILNQKILIANF
jgi:hydroxypyruvate reductase